MEMDRSEKQRRVFVVCVDGGTFDLIRPWVREGHLPCFQRLMREGVWAELSAEIPPITVNNVLSMVTGLLTPISAQNITYPPRLREEIENHIGDRYPILPKEVFAVGKEEEYFSSLMESLEIRYRASRYLMDRYPWDFLIVHFIETDQVQHFFWNYMDEDHLRHDREKSKNFGKAILQVYQRVDSILSDYLNLLDKKDYLMVVSDHGAGPLYKKFYTNNWLMKEGLLELKKDWITTLMDTPIPEDMDGKVLIDAFN